MHTIDRAYVGRGIHEKHGGRYEGSSNGSRIRRARDSPECDPRRTAWQG